MKHRMTLNRCTVVAVLGLVVIAPATAAAGQPDAESLFADAETLARGNQYEAAMEKVEAAVQQLDRTRAAGEKISWKEMNGLRFAAHLARDEFLDYKKAFFFCDKLSQLADSDYWRVPAALERALTFRAKGEFSAAQREYDRIAESDPRQQTSAVVPQAEMVYFDMGDRSRGQDLVIAALQNEAVNSRERFNLLTRCAQTAIADGQRELALKWYARAEELPVGKPADKSRFLSQAWFEMGKIEESRGRREAAKTFYRKSVQLPDGDMRFRVRARDALESIEYFE